MIRRISLPVQLLVALAFVFIAGPFFTQTTIRSFYTVSVFFKQILSFLLPLIIFTFVFSGITAMKKNAHTILIILLSAIFTSNGLVALLTYCFARLILPFLTATVCGGDVLMCPRTIDPFFSFALPVDICPQYTFFCTHISPYLPLIILAAGIFLGLIANRRSLGALEIGIVWIKQKLEWFFGHIFIPLLPLYVIGFLLKIQYEGVLGRLVHYYGGSFFLIVALQILYLFLFYYAAAWGDIKKTFTYIQNALASYLTAFSTMSSTATVPVSVDCAIKNTHNKPLAQMAMPIMANVHLLGDSVGTPILAMVTMQIFLGHLPSLADYMVFVLYFCFSMFAVSGIPGGGIIVMIPVLQTYLGFNGEMIGIMIALYMLLDAFGTAANVMGDGALVIMVNRWIKKLNLV